MYGDRELGKANYYNLLSCDEMNILLCFYNDIGFEILFDSQDPIRLQTLMMKSMHNHFIYLTIFKQMLEMGWKFEKLDKILDEIESWNMDAEQLEVWEEI